MAISIIKCRTAQTGSSGFRRLLAEGRSFPLEGAGAESPTPVSDGVQGVRICEAGRAPAETMASRRSFVTQQRFMYTPLRVRLVPVRPIGFEQRIREHADSDFFSLPFSPQ